MEASGFIIFF